MRTLINNPPLPPAVNRIKKELKKKGLQKKLLKLQPGEKQIIEKIKKLTVAMNQNNVTRTRAYLKFYQQYSEVHWAFLGHMVSRNGGWNMTDLKGDFLSRLLNKKQAQDFFAFLERGNWLIFQDVYPQFLLYDASIKKGESLFHLLPHFHVSTYMETVWNDFWKHQDSYILTVSQIINEQSYLEGRVTNHPKFKKEVLDSIEFMLQDTLSMNHILFPFEKDGQIELIGETLHHFESLHERILLGKRLYSLLFGEKKEVVEKWAFSNPHTGSRKDYWPKLFNDVNESVPGTLFKKRIHNCQLSSGASRIYSPQLKNAWKDLKQEDAELGDWYKNWKVIYYLIDSKQTMDGEIVNDYCKTLEKLDFVVKAKKAVPFLD